MNASGTQAFFRIGCKWFTIVGWLFLLPAGAAIADDSRRPLDGAERVTDADDSRQLTKVYSLKHAPGEQVASLLRSLFIVVDQQNAYARFQFDERTDSLIVTACEQHQKQIARILALVDTPNKAPAQAVDRDESEQVVRGYSIKHVDGNAAVSVLRSLFLVVNHRVAYARFGYDPRTGLLIAVASEKHQRQIAKVLELLDAQTTAAKETPQKKEGDTEQSIRVYPVKHIDGEQLVSKLRSQFVVVNHQTAQARFGFDERTHSLMVIATEKLQARIRDTFAILDQPPERSELRQERRNP